MLRQLPGHATPAVSIGPDAIEGAGRVASALAEGGGRATGDRGAGARSAGIDIMRGLCAILVVLHHVHLRFRFNKFPVRGVLPRALEQILFQTGYFSVIAFFVISGFLITSHSLRRWESLERLDWRDFYRLRLARIAPCLLLLVAVLSVLHWAQAREFVIAGERATWGRAVLAALTFHLNWLEGRYGYLPGGWDVLWSLSVEEVFYLAFPVACLLCRRQGVLLVPLLALIVVGPFNRAALQGQEPWAEYAYLSCVDGVAFGCITALLATRVRLTQNGARWIMAGGASLAFSIVVFRRPAAIAGLRDAGLDVSVLEVGVALVLLSLARGVGRVALTRGTGAIRMVGRCSYELYLTHMLVVLGCMPLIVAWQPEPLLIPLLYLGMLISSIALGWLVHRFYSEPLNRALRPRRASA